MTQFVTQVLSPSTEKACSRRAVVAEIPDHTNRTRTSLPSWVSSPWNTPRPSLPNAPVTGGNSFPLRLEDQFSDHSRAVLYRRWREPTDVRRRLEPYGLVLKAGRWYVVAGPGPRTFRVDQILRLDLCGEEFTLPRDFDLAAYWTAYQRDFHDRLHQGEAVIRVAPGTRLTGAAGDALAAGGVREPDGWTRATVPIESVDRAHDGFLALGAGIEVLEPFDLRDRIARTAAALARLYA
ncbi:helix-turn-helix transcriptional regulator [Streptomyces sp. NPDC005122]